MENNIGTNKFTEYVNQHVAIVIFLVEEQEKLIEIMQNDTTDGDGDVILKFLNKLEELEPFVDEFVDKYREILNDEEKDILIAIDAMEPSDVLKMMGKLSDLFDLSDTVMDIYKTYHINEEVKENDKSRIFR